MGGQQLLKHWWSTFALTNTIIVISGIYLHVIAGLFSGELICI